MPIIEVRSVTKAFRLGQFHSLTQSMRNAAARLLRKPVAQRPLFKALDNVDFTVEQGEVLGIIGDNGAGKSTLLKILAGISRPTHGKVNVNGRVAPLIEVGAGLVPDLTGRENIHLNAAILGMKRREIKRKFDEIVAFAELEEFIDTPIKRYSSGMQVRLGFAVATAIESEILIVDEVLAVGDLAFQRKCFDRMEQLIRRDGRTVLLVSHNIRQVIRICKRALLLDHGLLSADGLPTSVADTYYSKADTKIREIAKGQLRDRRGTTYLAAGVDVLSVRVEDSLGNQIEDVAYLGEATFVIEIQVHKQLVRPVFAIGIDTTDLLHLAAQRSERHLTVESIPPGRHLLSCRIARFPLLPSVYSVRVSIASGNMRSECFYAENLAYFQVTSSDPERADLQGNCFVQLDGNWDLKAHVTSQAEPSRAARRSENMT